MRIVYPGNHGNSFATERFVANAFEQLGHQVERLNVREHDHTSIVAAVKESQPDILLGAKFGFRGAESMDTNGAKAVAELITECRPHIGAAVCMHWDLCNPAFSAERFAWQTIVSAAVDLTCLTDGSIVPGLPNAVVVRDGCPDDIDVDFVPSEQIDAALFIGSLYRDRQLWAASMRRVLGPRFVHVGPDSEHGCEALGVPPRTEVTGKELTQLVRSFRLVCQPPTPFYPGYASDRSVIARAHGGLLVAPTVPGYGDGLVEWEHYLPASLNHDSYAAKMVEYLDRHDAGQLEAVRIAGQKHALARSWSNRVEQLLAELATRGLLGLR